MTILNRRQFMQLLAGTALAATLPLPPLPEIIENAPSAMSPSLAFKEMGESFAAGIAEGLNSLTVTEITTRAGSKRLDFSLGRPREIPDWSTQIFTVYGYREDGYIRRDEEYEFAIDSSEEPAGHLGEILEFVEGKLTPDHLLSMHPEPFSGEF